MMGRIIQWLKILLFYALHNCVRLTQKENRWHLDESHEG